MLIWVLGFYEVDEDDEDDDGFEEATGLLSAMPQVCISTILK
jgi:hypothetical protein